MGKLKNPYIIVMGCTGAGKSDAAIEIAKKFNGEVINGDSQQIYKGLDIATNKVTIEEMKGVKHHLMSFLEPDVEKYNVHQFKDDCIEVMNKLWEEGKVPIICGGTNYYIEGVLFKDVIIPTNNDEVNLIRDQLRYKSNDELYELLLEIDHISANQVHRNNRARVQRAIEIALTTGTKKCEFVEKQKVNSGKLRYENVLIFNMDAKKDVLNERLDKRVLKMVERGLKEELRTLYNTYHKKFGSHGIMQSIGMKEFIPWLINETDANFEMGVSDLQVHTRQYTRKQRVRLKNKLLNCNSINSLYLVDTTEAKDFYTKNIPIILDIVDDFINYGKIQDINNQYCKLWKSEEGSQPIYDEKDINKVYYCDVCSLELHGIRNWEAHCKGKKHKHSMKKHNNKNSMESNIDSDNE